MSDDRGGDRFACVSCGEPVPVDEVECPACGYGHVDTEELWAIGVLSPPVFLLFAVLVLWALDTFLPTAFGTLGPRGVVLVVAVLFAAPLAQFLRDHVAYRRAVADARGTPGLVPPAGEPSVTERLERLVVTARVGAAAVLVARLGGTVGTGPGYATALRIAGIAGGVLLLHAGATTYRLRQELRLRKHLARLHGAAHRAVAVGVRRTVAGTRTVVTGLAPYVADVVRGSRSVAADVRTLAADARTFARRVDAARRRLSERRAVPVGREGAAVTAERAERLWALSLASMERHWPAWGVAGVVELWVVAFETGVGVTYITETMLATWLSYTYFLFEDVAITRERYDWDPWWWSYSVGGLLPIVNIGVGTVYLLRRELVRRAVVGDETEGEDDRGSGRPSEDGSDDSDRS